MKLTKQIIQDNKFSYPAFEDYYRVIEVIEEKLEQSPDMSIESCKALVEGVSKTIINNLESEEKHKKDAHDLLKQALDTMEKHVFIERDFIRKTGSLILGIANIRNKRADISHGKAVPKVVKSSKELAFTIVSVTDSILYYILSIYFSIDLGKEIIEEETIYYDNEQYIVYNEMLDEQYAWSSISYSKALFEQDYDLYYEGFENFLEGMEEV